MHEFNGLDRGMAVADALLWSVRSGVRVGVQSAALDAGDSALEAAFAFGAAGLGAIPESSRSFVCGRLACRRCSGRGSLPAILGEHHWSKPCSTLDIYLPPALCSHTEVSILRTADTYQVGSASMLRFVTGDLTRRLYPFRQSPMPCTPDCRTFFLQRCSCFPSCFRIASAQVRFHNANIFQTCS